MVVQEKRLYLTEYPGTEIEMTMPIEKLFHIYDKKSDTREAIQDAKLEYDARLSTLSSRDRKQYDYLVTFINDVTKGKQSPSNIVDLARTQYDKLKRSTPDFRPDYIGSSRQSYRRIEDINGSDPTKEGQGNAPASVNHYLTLTDHPKAKQTVDLVYQSKNASYQMKRSNPHIADLSDPNRPTKIAERYSELYDNEWTEAFEFLIQIIASERKVIDFLLRVITLAYKLGLEKAERQIQLLFDSFIDILKTGVSQESNTTRSERPTGEEESLLRQVRKDKADLTIAQLKEEFKQKYLRDVMDDFGLKRSDVTEDGSVYKYANKCVEVTWWMCVHDPPVELFDPNSNQEPCEPYNLTDSMDALMYRAYTKKGSCVDYVVWPYLRLFKGGSILFKGVAQYK